jgi:hypothetical protein
MSRSRDELTAELHRILTTKAENAGAVGRIARRRGLAESTVYDRLYGKIIIDLDFILDAFLATSDPEIKAMLQPEGWVLVPAAGTGNATGDPEREVGDVSLALSALHGHLRAALADGRLSPNEIDRAERLLEKLRRETADIQGMIDRARANHGRIGKA